MATYDIKLSFTRVGQLETTGWPFEDLRATFKKTIPADRSTHQRLLRRFEPLQVLLLVVGEFPMNEIGQYEITAAQYCTFLNAVDPEGELQATLDES